MIKLFLKAKHWQLFLLTFGIPMIIHGIMMAKLMLHVIAQDSPDPIILFNYMKVFPVMMLVFIFILFGWYWSVVVGLKRKIPEELRINLMRFKIFFFIPLVYISSLLVFMVIFMNGILHGMEPSYVEGMEVIFIIIFPLHFLSMFCIFHSLYFAAKTFKTAELQRKVTFSDFVGEFFMIWFYPVGVWIVQPKINKMIKEKD